MTVQEAIDLLKKIEDKDQHLFIDLADPKRKVKVIAAVVDIEEAQVMADNGEIYSIILLQPHNYEFTAN